VTATPPDTLDTAATPEPLEYPSPRIVDSRRLMGPNIYSDGEGALLEVRVAQDESHLLAQLYAEWEHAVHHLNGEMQSPTMVTSMRADLPDAGDVWIGASLFLGVAADVLMTATELSEQAWVRAEQTVASGSAPPNDDVICERLRAAAAAERASRPNLTMLRRIAIQRRRTVTFDDEFLSLGSGEGALVWPLPEAPDAASVAWDTVRDVPIVLVTGSNGKTTTTRLVAAMWRAAGRVAGWCCSDGVWVGDEKLDSGDFSGPAGARAVLRNDRVQAAVLETARGGILRRGLAVHRANSAIITNIAADHFGEYGVRTLHDLARAKAVVAHAIDDDGQLVLNADDGTLTELGLSLTVPLAWFSMHALNSIVQQQVHRGGDAAVVRDGRIALHLDATWHDLGAVTDMPLALGGAAPHNVANLLGAALLAAVSRVPIDAIRETLAAFGASPSDNPGRLQVQHFGGLTVLVDYAHNPDGLAALCTTALAFPASRRLLILGQAGNRDDTQLRALVGAALDASSFDRVIIKEMERMLRGRAIGEMPRVFRDELSRRGVPDVSIEVAPSELDAVRRASAWARDGDVIVCPVHIEKQAVLALLARMRETGWTPGMPLPT